MLSIIALALLSVTRAFSYDKTPITILPPYPSRENPCTSIQTLNEDCDAYLVSRCGGGYQAIALNSSSVWDVHTGCVDLCPANLTWSLAVACNGMPNGVREFNWVASPPQCPPIQFSITSQSCLSLEVEFRATAAFWMVAAQRGKHNVHLDQKDCGIWIRIGPNLDQIPQSVWSKRRLSSVSFSERRLL